MIIDWSRDENASDYEIIDLATSEPVSGPYDEDIFYADDEAGIVRRYVRCMGDLCIASDNDPSVPVTDPRIEKCDDDGNLLPGFCLAWTEEPRSIQLVLKSELAQCLR